jgi:hypothetical protein
LKNPSTSHHCVAKSSSCAFVRPSSPHCAAGWGEREPCARVGMATTVLVRRRWRLQRRLRSDTRSAGALGRRLGCEGFSLAESVEIPRPCRVEANSCGFEWAQRLSSGWRQRLPPSTREPLPLASASTRHLPLCRDARGVIARHARCSSASIRSAQSQVFKFAARHSRMTRATVSIEHNADELGCMYEGAQTIPAT